MENDYLESIKKQFEYYKMLGEKTFSQVSDEALFWQYNEESNSIATIVKHLWGNMLSRWTDFLTTDGEKAWRQREAEFDNDINTREEMLQKWNEGWECLFKAIDSVNESNINETIYIRNMGHSVVEALNRQLAHYPYHIGQIVFIGKMAAGNTWNSLSIPRGNSKEYNADKFAKPKHKEHFTSEFLNTNTKQMKYKKHVFICTNQKDAPKKCCGDERGMALVDAFKNSMKEKGLLTDMRAQKTGCLDFCAFGPVMVVYPEGVFYGNVQLSDVEEIIESHLVNDVPVERLVIG